MDRIFWCEAVLEEDHAAIEVRAEEDCGNPCPECYPQSKCVLTFGHFGNHRCGNGHTW